MDATLFVVSIGLLRGVVSAIAGVLVIGVLAVQLHLFRRRHDDSRKETR